MLLILKYSGEQVRAVLVLVFIKCNWKTTREVFPFTQLWLSFCTQMIHIQNQPRNNKDFLTNFHEDGINVFLQGKI